MAQDSDDQSMSTSEAGKLGAQEQPDEAKREGGRESGSRSSRSSDSTDSDI